MSIVKSLETFGLKKIGIIICALYLANFTFGVAEPLPDNVPFIGNVDEVIVSYIAFKLSGMMKS